MNKHVTRRFFIGAAVASLLPSGTFANAPKVSLRPMARGQGKLLPKPQSVEEVIAAARLDGTVAFCVANTRTGAILETHEPDHPLPPASVAKALSAGYALSHLGPNYRFETRVMATGGVKDGVVQGDLILVGGGDPALDTDGLALLARRLSEAGVTGLKGAFKVWGGPYPFARVIDADQPEHVSYNPAVSGLNLNYNRVHFEWRQQGASYAVTMEARTDSLRPAVKMARMGIEPRTLPIYTYADRNGRDDWTVAKSALGKGGSRWLPVRKPELYAGEVFQSLVKARGITLPAPEVVQALPAGALRVAKIDSLPMVDLLHDMLKWSTNLTAEIVGLTASARRLGRWPVSSEESASEMNKWAAESLGVKTLALVDHSGLADRSRVKAADMMAALLALHKSQDLKPLMKEFQMRDGNRKVVENHPIKVHAKTGTLNFVSGLAGFADLPGGTELVFAIFTANMDRRATLSMDERESPEGGSAWNTRAKTLQQKLIERWGALYAA